MADGVAELGEGADVPFGADRTRDDLEGLADGWWLALVTEHDDYTIARFEHEQTDAVCLLTYEPGRADLQYVIQVDYPANATDDRTRFDWPNDAVQNARTAMESYHAGVEATGGAQCQ